MQHKISNKLMGLHKFKNKNNQKQHNIFLLNKQTIILVNSNSQLHKCNHLDIINQDKIINHLILLKIYHHLLLINQDKILHHLILIHQDRMFTIHQDKICYLLHQDLLLHYYHLLMKLY
jgi:hypothetical protein